MAAAKGSRIALGARADHLGRVRLLLRFDRAQLAFADAAVAWLWHTLELSRRTLLRLAVVGMLASQMLAQLATAGRIDPLTLGLAAVLLVMFASTERRLGGSPELQRAVTLAHRTRPLPTFIRLAVWPWTAYSMATGLGSRAAPLELAGDLFFLVAIIASHALPPAGPPRTRRRRESGRSSAALTPVRFGART